MFEKLAKRICEFSPEELANAHLEDLGLCAAWLDSFRDQPEATEPYNGLRQQFDLWVTLDAPPTARTAGRRQQPYLRKYIDRVIEGGSKEMDRDELDFVYFCWGMASRTADKGKSERLLECITPYLNEVQVRRKVVPLRPGLPTLREGLGIFFRDDLRNAEPRDIKVFAGLDFPCRGPVLTHRGLAKFPEGIPDDAVVVVEDGFCAVNGPVSGRLAVADGCDILGNVSGVVVSRQGAIRARNLVRPANVVSKEGRVYCAGTDHPALVFGAQLVNIDGDARGGRYRGRSVKISGDITGGEIQVSGEATANCFHANDDRPLAIALRRTLSCRDYNEVMTTDGMRLLTSALRLRQFEVQFGDLIRTSENEADEYAGMALSFLFGDDSVSEEVRTIEVLRRQTTVLDRLEAAAESLVGNIDDWLAMDTESSDMSEDRGVFIEDLRRDLSALTAEGRIEPSVSRAQEEILDCAKKCYRRGLKRSEALVLMRQLLEKKEQIAEQSAEITIQIKRQEQLYEKLANQYAVLKKAKDEQRRGEVFKQLLLAARRNPSESIRRRAADRYVLLMRRYIENRRSRVAEYRSRIKKIENDIDAIRGKLWKTHQVSLPLHVLQGFVDDTARATGMFSEGVRVCAWQHLLADGVIDDRTVLLTGEASEKVLSFARTGHGTIQRR